VLLRLAAPIMVFTCEEIWSHFPRIASDPESVHLTLFADPEKMGLAVDGKTKENWEKLLQLRRSVLAHLEVARNAKQISSALEAKVLLNGANQDAAVWEQYAKRLPALFIVSQVEIVKPGEPLNADVCLGIKRADGTKCERCWNYSARVG